MFSKEIVIPRKITEAFINEHKDYIFLYSFDVAGNSCFGQCVVCIGKSNCFPIPVLLRYCSDAVHFMDTHMETNKEVIRGFLNHVPKDGRPIIPIPKWGRGFSRMKEKSPHTFNYLSSCIYDITYPTISIDYRTL